MAKNKVSMPSGMGGLVRYYDDVKSKLEIKPMHIIFLIIIVIFIELFLHWKGSSIFGLG